MRVAETGVCQWCNETFVVGDDYCEGCGKRLTPEPVAGRDASVEVDLGFAASVSNRGLVHQRNEDAVHVAGVHGRAVVVLSDGVTQSALPHLAARAAVETAGRLLDRWMSGDPDLGRDAVAATTEALSASQAAVTALPWPGSPDESPACTFVSAVWDGYEITVCSVGDSRAYWLDADGVTLLTRDDTLTDDERDPRHHTITRWLGRDAPTGPLDIVAFHPDEPGRLLVCSDGLWGYVSSPGLLDALVRSPDGRSPLEVARDLVDHALGAGGRDNVSVAVVEITPDLKESS